MSRINVRKHGMVAHVGNPGTGQVGIGGSLGLLASYSSLMGELLPSERPCLKTWIDDITKGQHWRRGYPCATIHIGTHM